MGMAASQCTFGALTRRKHDIGVELERCSMQKTSLARDMRKVTLKYQDALNTKTLKWSNNAGVTYVDLSYNNLMRPSNANQNKPYLITDTAGRIVLDDKYKEYAEMISPDGKPVGNWSSNENRTKILAQLTGISEAQLNNSVTSSETANAATKKVETIREEYDVLKSQEPTVENSSAKDFMSKIGNVSGNDLEKLFSQTDGKINLGSSSSGLQDLLDGICKNIAPYLTEDDQKAFQSACNTYFNNYSSLYGQSADQLKNSGTGFTVDKGNYYVNVQQMMNEILGSYVDNDGSSGTNKTTGAAYYTTRDTQSNEWQDWNAKLGDKQKELDTAMEEYRAAVDNDNQSLTSEQESAIAFYDQIFSAIAENGWTYNSQINDTEYLNNMFQNNEFYITTMEEKTDDNGKNFFEYENSLASNFDNVISVNDKDAQAEALVEYEYEKSVINEKETRIDTRMQDLETEQSAINNMMKGVETVRNDNIERNFSIEA